PAYRAADLIEVFDADLAAELNSIPYESVATVNMAFRHGDIGRPANGFGFVIPEKEKKGIVACTMTSVKYPGCAPEDKILLRAFVGGAMHRRQFELDDRAMEEMVYNELQPVLGIKHAPLFTAIRRYAKSMPQYHVGHLDRVDAIMRKAQKHPGL